MKKRLMAFSSLALLVSMSALADQRDAVPLGDTRFEVNPRPAHGSGGTSILPNMGIVSVRQNSDNVTSVLLETGRDGDCSFLGISCTGVPMQLEVTGNSDQIDISKARASVARFLEKNTWVDGYNFNVDFAELDYSNREIGDHSIRTKTLNAARFVPVFAFSLDSGERVVVKLKGDLALGITQIISNNTGLEQIDFNASSQYGASAGVELFKQVSADGYTSASGVWGSDIKTSTSGIRAKANLPNFAGLKNSSVQAYRECNKLTVDDNVSKKCTTGAGFSVGF